MKLYHRYRNMQFQYWDVLSNHTFILSESESWNIDYNLYHMNNETDNYTIDLIGLSDTNIL